MAPFWQTAQAMWRLPSALRRGGAHALEDELLRRDAGLQVAFFDVFDTLIERTVEPPEAIKLAVCHVLAGFVPARANFAAMLESRQRVEHALRNRSKDNVENPEPKLNDLLLAWTADYLGSPVNTEQLAQLVAVELEMERRTACAVPGMVALLGALVEAGWTLYFIAETSLHVSSIWELLEGCGYGGHFTDGLVSCRVSLSDRDDGLFRRCLNQWGYTASDVVYVSAERENRIRSAFALGMHAFWFRDPAKDLRIASARIERRYGEEDDVLAGAWLTNTVIRHVAQTRVRHCDTLYRTGLCVLGPLLGNFVHRLILRSVDDRTDLLVFAAREGFVLGEIYERLTARLSGVDSPPCVYAYISRKSTYGAALRAFGDWEMYLGTQTPRPTIGKLLARFSVSQCVAPEVLHELGFSGLDAPIDAGDPRVVRLFAHRKLEPCWRAVAAEQCRLLRDYLSGLGVRIATRPALVDPGWFGSIQVSINGALQEAPGWPSLRGYYLLLLPPKVPTPAYAGEMKGLLHDGRASRVSVPIGRFVELIEAACRAPHGTTVGYERLDGQVLPQLRGEKHQARQAELCDRHYVTALQAGIFDYIDGYCELIGLRSQPPAADTPYVMSLLDRLIRYPSAAEARALSALNHSEDVGLGLVAKHRHGRRVVAEGDRLLWLEGHLRKIGGLPVLIFYNLYRAIVRRSY